MVKIIIIGGGIAGLAAATILADMNKFDIELYEKNPQIGGQAASEFSGTCFIEYSWRIFGQSYHNIMYIIQKLGIKDNFTTLKQPCFITKDSSSSGNLNSYNLLYQSAKTGDFNTLNKILNLGFICRDRALNDYQDVNAYHYFNKNPIIQSILGPILGMDANKVSLSGFYKNIYSVSDKRRFNFSPTDTLITRGPTQNSLFDPWLKYLQNKGVKVYTNHQLQSVNTRNNIINNIIINNKFIKGDEYIFSCSLDPLIRICSMNNDLKYCPSIYNLQHLSHDLQLYFTINLYFSEPLITSNTCSEMVIVDMPWKPIIQKKRNWQQKYLKRCKKPIQDIWNVGFLDYNKGIKIKKILRDCTLKEAIDEGIYQIKESQYIKKLLKNKSFDDIFIGYEYWPEFVNKNNKLISTNPKFSINTKTMKYMPTNQPHDIPKNMYLAGYYVKSTMGGVSMEASCETGLDVGQKILNKYNIKNDKIIPINHEIQYVNFLTIPFVYLDKVLYKAGIQPITSYIPSSVLIFLYILFLLAIFFFILYVKLFKK